MSKRIKKSALVIIFLLLLALFPLHSGIAAIRISGVDSYQEISDSTGGFGETLDSSDSFGNSIVNIGDLNGDGVIDLAVGAFQDDDGGSTRGAIYILFMNTDGTVDSTQKISDTEGGFTATLFDYDRFGYSIAAIGDLNGDDVPDLAVGADGDDDGGGGGDRGAVYILFMNTDGTVDSFQTISDTAGDFTATLDDGDRFGSSVVAIGDLNGDDVPDLAVGAHFDDDGGTNHGAVYILFMNTDGTVDSFQKISDTAGDFTATLDDGDFFGLSAASIGDLNGDGVIDLAVGAFQDDDGGSTRGAIYILFMNTDGTVDSFQKISDTAGDFTATLDDGDLFGVSVAGVGDLNDDDIEDVVVGSGDSGGMEEVFPGAIHLLFMNTDGTVDSFQTISDTEGGFTATFTDEFNFGSGVTSVGDFNDDDVVDLAVGAKGADGAKGAVFVLFIDGSEIALSLTESNGSTIVGEDGITDSISATLASAPTADVEITVAGDSQVSVSPSLLTFTTGNFSSPQNVTVTAITDDLQEGDHTGAVTFTASSTDAFYDDLSAQTVTVTVEDNAPSVSGGRSSRSRSSNNSNNNSNNNDDDDSDDDSDDSSSVSDLLSRIVDYLQGLQDEGKALPSWAPAFMTLDAATTPGAPSTIAHDLELGDNGADVETLQSFLIDQAAGPAATALSAVGPTDFFGPLTQAALAEYQAAHGITPPAGYFGPITRAYLVSVGY